MPSITVACFCLLVSQKGNIKRGERMLAGEARTMAAYERQQMIEEDMDRRRIAAKREQRIKFLEANSMKKR